MHRLFVALRLPPAIRQRLLALQDAVAGARWQDDEQLHLTIRYIGEVERPVAEDVAAALERLATPAIRLCLSRVGWFDGDGGARGGGALWAGVDPREPLAALHRKVDQACVRAGLAPERRSFVPHVTLARLPRRRTDAAAIARWLGRHAALASEPFDATHLVLYESHLGTGGATYEAITRWPLG
jgi:2'-5' RNA ligase